MTQKSFRLLIAALLFSMQLSASDDTPIGDAVNELPIFDAHMHYHEPVWSSVEPSLVISLMDRNKVSRSLLSAAPDDGVIQLLNYAPDRFIPEASPYHDDISKSNWADVDPDRIVNYLTQRLDKHLHEGMGELVIFSYDPRHDEVLKRLAALADSRDLLLHLHADHKAVDMIYRHRPDVTIIWAHAGMVDPPHIVKQTMDKYPNLYADLSYREHEILSQGQLNPEWKAVLIEHADRFMVGSDTWNNQRWRQYDWLIKANRQWLALMPRSVAEAIAYKNAQRVFKRDMSEVVIHHHKHQH